MRHQNGYQHIVILTGYMKFVNNPHIYQGEFVNNPHLLKRYLYNPNKIYVLQKQNLVLSL